MVKKSKSASATKAGKKYGRRKMRVPRVRGQTARVIQMIEVDNETANVITSFENLSLKAFDRAAGVGRFYQFYRMTYVKVTFKPLYDTWGSQLVTGSVPYLYYLIDNGYNFSPSFCNSFNSMRDAGAKPIRLDDQNIVVTFKPAVAVGVGDLQVTPGSSPNQTFVMAKKSPWLNTNANSADVSGNLTWKPNATDHRGIWFGVEQDVLQGGNQNIPYTVTIEACFDFKKPLSFSNPAGEFPPHRLIDLEDPTNIKQN